MRKTVHALAGLLLGLLALAQSTGGSGGLGGFFGEVLSYVGEAFSGLPNTTGTDLAIREACAQAGLPTSLRVTSVGTTRSPFCPGQVTAVARTNEDWLATIEGGTRDWTQATKTDVVRSGGTTQFEVEYRYNPLFLRWEASLDYSIPEANDPNCTIGITSSDTYRSGTVQSPNQPPDSVRLYVYYSVTCQYNCGLGEPGCPCQRPGDCRCQGDQPGSPCSLRTWRNDYEDRDVPTTIVEQFRRYRP